MIDFNCLMSDFKKFSTKKAIVLGVIRSHAIRQLDNTLSPNAKYPSSKQTFFHYKKGAM